MELNTADTIAIQNAVEKLAQGLKNHADTFVSSIKADKNFQVGIRIPLTYGKGYIDIYTCMAIHEIPRTHFEEIVTDEG